MLFLTAVTPLHILIMNNIIRLLKLSGQRTEHVCREMSQVVILCVGMSVPFGMKYLKYVMIYTCIVLVKTLFEVQTRFTT